MVYLGGGGRCKFVTAEMHKLLSLHVLTLMVNLSLSEIVQYEFCMRSDIVCQCQKILHTMTDTLRGYTSGLFVKY